MATKELCAVEGCGKSVNTRGWCRGHYWRFLKYRDPLKGAAQKGRSLDYYRNTVLKYEGDDCIVWPYLRNPKGYATMKVKGKSRIVSRFLCEEIHGAPPTKKHHAAHSCGRGSNGCVTKAHVSWKTAKENEADKRLHGTIIRGERHKKSKLTEEQVLSIRRMKENSTQRAIAAMFGVGQQTISRIHSGRAWGWL